MTAIPSRNAVFCLTMQSGLRCREANKELSRKGRGMDNCGKRPADGDVWIENGKFKVCDPEAGGRPAVLIPVPEVKLLINGKPTGQMTTVSAADEIAASVSTTAAPPFSISVAADKMTASLCLNSRAFIRRVLEDTAPQNQLQPRVKEERADIVPGASPSDIIRELNRNGVSFGVDYVAIREALSGNVFDTPLPVAKGKKPVPGTDARMEYHVERDITRVQTDLTEEKVDYHAVLQIPSVIPGQLLATKHPLQPGENGIAVTGEVVPATACPGYFPRYQTGSNRSCRGRRHANLCRNFRPSRN